MKTKKIFKALAMVMLLPAMLLTTACSNDDDAVNNDNTAKKGYPLQVTVNVTRQGDGGTTRATYNESTRKLEFSAGDQLFVTGVNGDEGSFAGTLDYVSEGTFSGTIYTQNEYSGTAKELLEASGAYAILLPAGYDKYNFLSILYTTPFRADPVPNYSGAFATSKVTAVEQFSLEYAYSYSNGFALRPQHAILNFTITGLTPSTDVTATLTDGSTLTISGSVKTDGSGTATFAMALQGDDPIALSDGYDLNNFSLTVGSTAITLVSSSTPLTAGHIYNITRSAVTLPEGALSGKFTISNDNGTTTRQVYFSKGNLQAVIASGPTDTYNYTASSWKFADNQWDYIGSNPGNTSFASGTTVDLFGWVGASASYDTYGLCTLTSSNNAYYGTDANDNLKSDWGTTMGPGWFTLKANEWGYLFTGRTTGGTVGSTSQARYTMATIRTDVGFEYGVILFPDGVDIENSTDYFTTLGDVNNASYYDTRCTSAQWTALENKGCVFLPAAGNRNVTYCSSGSDGYYWSSSSYTSRYVYYVKFYSGSLSPDNIYGRDFGMSVRLVREVE